MHPFKKQSMTGQQIAKSRYADGGAVDDDKPESSQNNQMADTTMNDRWLKELNTPIPERPSLPTGREHSGMKRGGRATKGS